MRLLLDTCVISEIVKPKPVKKVISWLEGVDDYSLFLSVLTIGEIQKGIFKLRQVDTKRSEKYEHFLQDKIIDQYRDRILMLDLDVMMSWGTLMGEKSAKGEPMPIMDGLIAATALTHDMTIVTRNVKDFQRIRLKIFNPWE